VITAVDTSVLLDVFLPDPTFGPPSREALQICLDEGSLVACEIVWAEVGSFFALPITAEAAMGQLGVAFSAITQPAALTASSAWRAYRTRSGRRDRMVADFLIATHALSQADRLLTRDRGFYRTYFSRVRVLDPRAVRGRSR
jgi:predicted nucleic acid-binding protein